MSARSKFGTPRTARISDTVAQMEREIDAEYVHLGLINEGDSVFLTDDELVAELLS